MQEHPVPQNVTSFEFKLIGDMTLRQFGYVATGGIIAFITYVSPTPSQFVLWVIKMPIIIGSLGLGFALAFMPIEGRPLDRWITAFFLATFGNTLYVWKKEGVQVSALHNLLGTATISRAIPASQPGPRSPSNAAQAKAIAYQQVIRSNTPQTQNHPLDSHDYQAVRQVSGMKPHIAHTLAGKVPVNQVSLKPSTPATPVSQGRITSFAGAAKPLNTLSLQQPSQIPRAPGQIFPSIMRTPAQKPLAPKKIGLPDYQRDHIVTQQHPATQPTAQNQSLVASLYSGETGHTSTKALPVSGSQPNIPSQTPKIQPQQPDQSTNKEMDQLKKQNQELFQQLQSLQTSLKQANQTEITSLKTETKTLQDHLATLENTLTQYKQTMASMTNQGADDQKKLATLAEQLDALHKEKEQTSSQLQSLQAKEQADQNQLVSSLAENRKLAEQLAHVKDEAQKTTQQTQPESPSLPAIAQQPKSQLEQKLQTLEDAHWQANNPPPPSTPVVLPPINLSLPATPVVPPPAPAVIQPNLTNNSQSGPTAVPTSGVPAAGFSIVTPQVVINQAGPATNQMGGASPASVSDSKVQAEPVKPGISEKQQAAITEALREGPPQSPFLPDPVPVVAFEAKSVAPQAPIPNALSGFVLDADHKPVMGAIVVVKKAGGPTMRALRTNKVGQFSMVSPLPDGSYEAIFEKDGFNFDKMPFETHGKIIDQVTVIGKKVA